MTQATQIRLNKRADGVPQDDVWATTHDALPALGDGEIAVDVEYVSVDPAMRGWIIDTPSYLPPVQIGEVMRAGRSEEHTSELQSPVPISYAVFCLKKKKINYV